MKFFNFQKRTVAYQVFGQSKQPLVIMIHPLGMNLNVWNDVGKQLAEHYSVASLNLPGHGQSQGVQTTEQLTFADLAAQTFTLAQHLEHDSFHFVGTSIGGQVGMELLKIQMQDSAPMPLRSVTLTNTAYKIGTVDSWQQRADNVRSKGLASMASEIVPRWFALDFQKKHPELLQYWSEQLAHTDQESYAQLCELLAHSNYHAMFTKLPKTIQQNMLLVAGDDDLALPLSVMQETASLLTDTPLQRLSVGHVPAVESPDAMTKLLQQHFLSRDQA